MSDTKEHISHHENAPVRQKKKGGCARHCKRFWWIYLIVFIVVAVLAVVLIIFVAVPKIAQSKINESELDVQGVNILQTTEDSFVMEINSTIKTDGKVKADIDGFQGSMSLADYEPKTVFAMLDFPATNGDKNQVVNVSQEITIEDLEAFTLFNTFFVTNQTVKVVIEGKTKVKPHGLDRKYDVDFKKTLEFDGLNLFQGTEVLGGEIDIGGSSDDEDEEDVRNFHGTVDIPNASHFTLDIGNVSFINYADGKEVGTLYIDNLLLLPGSNVLNMSANLEQAEVLKLLQSDKYCEDGIIPFQLQGKTVENMGQNLTYFADALASANQTVEINIGKIVKDSLGSDIGCSSSSSGSGSSSDDN